MTEAPEIAAYAEALEKMLGELASPEMLRLVARQHDHCADLCAGFGRDRADAAGAFRAAARALRARAAALEA